MIRILKFLVTGNWHLHIWEDLYSVECKDDCGGLWQRYYCKCKICGEHKKFD